MRSVVRGVRKFFKRSDGMKTMNLQKKPKHNVLFVRLTPSIRSDLVQLQKLTNESANAHALIALENYLRIALKAAIINTASCEEA